MNQAFGDEFNFDIEEIYRVYEQCDCQMTFEFRNLDTLFDDEQL